MQFIDIATEQTTAATDALLFLVAALFALLLSRASRESDRKKGRIWVAAFALLAIASALGAIAHGFKMNARANELIWMPLNLALGLTVALNQPRHGGNFVVMGDFFQESHKWIPVPQPNVGFTCRAD